MGVALDTYLFLKILDCSVETMPFQFEDVFGRLFVWG